MFWLLMLACGQGPVCGPGTSIEDGMCVAVDDDENDTADEDVGTDTEVSSDDPCAPHGVWDDAACACDAGYVQGRRCETCEEDADLDGCHDTAFEWGGSCYCGQGTGVNRAGCACKSDGSLGAACYADADCTGTVEDFGTATCLHHTSELESHGDLQIPFPGGYCGLAYTGWYREEACEAAGGVYVHDEPFDGANLNVCLYACVTDDQCREGYACRTLESFAVPEALDIPLGVTYCLPD